MLNSTNSFDFYILNNQDGNDFMSIQSDTAEKQNPIKQNEKNAIIVKEPPNHAMTTKNFNSISTASQMQSSNSTLILNNTASAMINHSISFNHNPNNNESQIKESAFETVNNMVKPLKPQSLNNNNNNNNNNSNYNDKDQLHMKNTDYVYHRINEVHNYAKLNNYGDSNDFSDSSLQEDDDEDDEDLPDVNMMDYNEDSCVRYFDRRQRSMSESIHKTYGHIKKIKTPSKIFRAISEDNEYIDVETIPKDHTLESLDTSNTTPDHHARRPMNAFLIFCKRHRAIVKEKYKSYENRAITRILGDWWASLEEKDKICFTELAKMNKDAFFSANPNFKWYKLPAPPLRTLNTRPSNYDRSTLISSPSIEHLACTQTSHTIKNDNYFKFADVNQMGDLSSLMNEGANISNFQQNSEATHYFGPSSLNEQSSNKVPNPRLYSENSFSSNSSEEDGSPKKPSRSCKGKIYQELINSGQIAPSNKKTKIGNNSCQQKNETSTATMLNNNYLSHCNGSTENKTNIFNRRSFSESETINYNIERFDLEERIKELPALSLDDYLARKRDTKKKKKFTPKKRGSNTNATVKTKSPKKEMNSSSSSLLLKQESSSIKAKDQCAPEQIVGSRKRKARKESITRRDVSSIENEVTALIPRTDTSSAVGACYYINTISECPQQQLETGNTSDKNTYLSISSLNMDDTADESNVNVNRHENILASTSDLFILAEVAAKRTELMN